MQSIIFVQCYKLIFKGNFQNISTFQTDELKSSKQGYIFTGLVSLFCFRKYTAAGSLQISMRSVTMLPCRYLILYKLWLLGSFIRIHALMPFVTVDVFPAILWSVPSHQLTVTLISKFYLNTLSTLQKIIHNTVKILLHWKVIAFFTNDSPTLKFINSTQ